MCTPRERKREKCVLLDLLVGSNNYHFRERKRALSHKPSPSLSKFSLLLHYFFLPFIFPGRCRPQVSSSTPTLAGAVLRADEAEKGRLLLDPSRVLVIDFSFRWGIFFWTCIPYEGGIDWKREFLIGVLICVLVLGFFFFSFCSGLGFLIGSISGFSFRSRFRFFFCFCDL